jgi:hypothetical protein
MHHPVVNKNGEIITSAVTNLDLHDISRASKTYGVRAFYVITPLAEQQILTERIVSHWTRGAGGTYNPNRREALRLIRVTETLEEAAAEIAAETLMRPVTVVTSARRDARSIDYPKLREKLGNGNPHLLIFGTGWGLADTLISAADYILEPVTGNTGYNHLSVRSAAAVVLDRLIGRL